MNSRKEKSKEVISRIKKEKLKKHKKRLIITLITIFILLLLIFLYIYFIEPRIILVHEYNIINEKIPDSFYGKKIIHFSDLLYGNTTDSSTLEKLKEKIDKAKPDIIIYTGDLISKKYTLKESDIKALQEFFNNLESPLGKYAIYGEDQSSFNTILDSFNILNNEDFYLYNKDNTPIKITGININDNNYKLKEEDLYNIILIHNYDDYSRYNLNSDLILAGHNLGGEIKLFSQEGLLGNNKYNGSHYNNAYITNGIGTNNHLRLLNYPSINIYRLKNK